ncbi:MAG: Hsp33 family molecular chaperone HslO [Bacilli bacterium]|nr:Hsp33 family molecular chaperone HslO [Bacilli bacterium]
MKDILLSALSKNQEARVYAIRSTDLVEEARKIHRLSPISGAALGRALTASLIMGALLKDENATVTLQFRGDGPLRSIVAISDASGSCRGYVGNPEVVILEANATGHLPVGKALGRGSLTVIKDLHLKEPYVSTTQLVSGEIAEDLTYYFASSEQTPTSVGLGVYFGKDLQVEAAGGFLLQLLPGAKEETISLLEENLRKIPSVTNLLRKEDNPKVFFDACFGNMEYEILQEKEVGYRCHCSQEKTEQALCSLGEKGLQELIDDGKEARIHCEFCQKDYVFSQKRLVELKESLQKRKNLSKNE